MEFEYDEQKSESNRTKHGIDFEEAKALWLDQSALYWETRSEDEDRFLIVARIEGVLWTGVWTFRGEKIRMISVRKSRGKEVESYDNR